MEGNSMVVYAPALAACIYLALRVIMSMLPEGSRKTFDAWVLWFIALACVGSFFSLIGLAAVIAKCLLAFGGVLWP